MKKNIMNKYSYWFTADEHFSHNNILKYCNRPFKSIESMNNAIINRHNAVVNDNDIVIHAGDFTFKEPEKYIERLKGKHIFIKGSHDKWIPEEGALKIWEKEIEGIYIVVCHYAMRTWARSHYNSWQLFGHSHGQLEGMGKQMDIGVDTHNFYPYSFDQIKKVMDKKEDNFNLVEKHEK